MPDMMANSPPAALLEPHRKAITAQEDSSSPEGYASLATRSTPCNLPPGANTVGGSGPNLAASSASADEAATDVKWLALKETMPAKKMVHADRRYMLMISEIAKAKRRRRVIDFISLPWFKASHLPSSGGGRWLHAMHGSDG
jgi:hypothetical protein